MEASQVMTIEDIITFANERNMPLEQMRFFIGIDYREPKAFGIYRDDNGQVVVYKNKADGTRAIRYCGTDEAFAVSEIMKKLADEIQLRNSAYRTPAMPSPEMVRRRNRNKAIAFLIVAILIGLFIFWIVRSPNNGYYNYNGTSYYYQSGDWYYYDDTYNDWVYYNGNVVFYDNYYDYYQPDYYYNDYGVSDFYDTPYYQNYNSNNYDNGYNSNDSWDSWDYNDSNWDSDW